MDLYGEFAVEPAALKSWGNFRELESHFGFSKGPLISRYPRRWVDDVKKWGRREFGGTVRISDFTNKLKHIEQYALVPSGRSFEGSKSWRENVVENHAKRSFAKIIASGTGIHSDAIEFDDLDAAVLDSFGQCMLPQRVDDFCKATRLLLINSKNIKFIDPFLSPKRLKMIIAMIRLARDGRAQSPVIELHTSSIRSGQSVDLAGERSQFREELVRRGLAEQSIKVYWWKDEDTKEIHPRYLITEKGGIQFDRGFYESPELSAKEGTFPAVVLRQSIVTDIFNRYRTTTSSYQCVQEESF